MHFHCQCPNFYIANFKMGEALVGYLPSMTSPPILSVLWLESYFFRELSANCWGQISLKIWSAFEIIWYLSTFWKYFASMYCQSSLRSFSALLFYRHQNMFKVISKGFWIYLGTYLIGIWHYAAFLACFLCKVWS